MKKYNGVTADHKPAEIEIGPDVAEMLILVLF